MSRLSRLFAVPLLFLGLTLPAAAAPAIWEASDGDSSIWLFGSFHLLPQETEWRTPLFDKTLAHVAKVYFEADIGPEQQAAVVTQSFMRGYNVDGSLLSDTLDRKQMAALRVAAAEANLPVPMLLTMKPWMAANALSLGAMTLAGYDPARGVDNLLQQELPAERKGYFETVDEQLEFLAGAPMDEQVAMLDATLAEFDEFPSLLEAMLAAWTEGTPDTIAELFLAELTGYEEGYIERLIYERNRNWMTPIEAMLANNEAAMVVVGTAHLVGEGSVVDLLAKDGFTVQRIQ